MFVYTTAIDKMRGMKARKKVVQGGTSAGKTFGILPILIDKCTRKPGLRITVVAESIPALKGGAVRIFKSVMQDTQRWFEERWLGNPMEYRFANGSVIEFRSFDTVGKAKAAGKRDILFINEAQYIPFEIADALMIRSLETWIDFNPDNEFWAHTEVLPEPNSEFLLLTYKDNEALPPETLEDLMIKQEKAKTSEYWANWCRVYIDGEIGSLQGVVFDFKQLDEIPASAELIGYGLDWGFTNDPSALIACYRIDKQLIFDELMYERRLTNRMIAAQMEQVQVSKYKQVVADSAEPKSIADLWNFGWSNVEASKKGPDSIRASIDKLQQWEIFVTSRSRNTIAELRSYVWDKDKAGNPLSVPVGKADHSIACMRYIALNLLSEGSGEYHID